MSLMVEVRGHLVHFDVHGPSAACCPDHTEASTDTHTKVQRVLFLSLQQTFH